MHDIKFIRDNPTEFDRKLATRFLEPMSAKILELDHEHRKLITKIQQVQQLRNEKVKLISDIKDKKSPEFKQAIEDAQQLKLTLQELEAKLSDENEITGLLAPIPNLPSDEVPIGPDEDHNQIIRNWGEIPNFNFKPKEHYELGEALGLMDFEQTAKISGSRFVTLTSSLAKLERALANFMLDIHTREFNYVETYPPLLVRDPAMYGVGQLPKFEEDSFKTTDNYRLIPTAEVSLTNLVREQILDCNKLPLRYTAYTPCFRSEAGSAGRDTKGMFRQHQFSKVELVSITTAEDSPAEHERLTKAAETILQQLKLPYRVMLLSTGDMGFSAKKTYDLEVWLPGQNKYREISSCSNCGDFQARRMQAKYRDGEKNIKFVHTLNGSALAIGRTIIAIMENYQNEDGSITIPEVLVPYMNGMEIISK